MSKYVLLYAMLLNVLIYIWHGEKTGDYYFGFQGAAEQQLTAVDLVPVLLKEEVPEQQWILAEED